MRVSDEAGFGRALEALRREVESQIGAEDAKHILRIGALSRRLEWIGRGLLAVSFEPVGFGVGTAALWAHKALELMEIGHPALHGAYDGLPGAEAYDSRTFRWKAPVDEASWRVGHNQRHHQYTNIAGLDPDLDFGALRLSARIPFRRGHRLQPLTNLVTWFGFGTALNLHVTGMLERFCHRSPAGDLRSDRSAAPPRPRTRAFLSKQIRYYGREYLLFPALAGPFFPKVLLGNLLSEIGKDVFAGAIIYCGHVGTRDFPAGTTPENRAQWYVMQVESSRDVELPQWLSILCGALDRQIEHHLFPRLPPNRLRQIAPRVRAICEAHGVRYRTASWPATLRDVIRQLAVLRSPAARPSEAATAAAPLAAFA